MTDKVDVQNLKFEEALKILEALAERMSSGKEDLDSMLNLYEEAIGYLKICKQKLAESELKVHMLNERIKDDLPEEDENG